MRQIRKLSSAGRSGSLTEGRQVEGRDGPEDADEKEDD